ASLPGACGPLERASTEVIADRLHRRRLLAHTGLRPMKLEKKRGLGVESLELGVANAGVHLHVVEELDASDRNTRLHRHDHRVHRAGEIRELAYRSGDRFRHAVEAQLDFGDDAERSLGTDEQPGQVVARARLARAPSGMDDATLRGD